MMAIQRFDQVSISDLQDMDYFAGNWRPAFEVHAVNLIDEYSKTHIVDNVLYHKD